MTEPERMLRAGNAWERELLAAGADEPVPREVTLRMAAALGLAAPSLPPPVLPEPGLSASAVAAKGATGGLLLKLGAGVALVATVATGWVGLSGNDAPVLRTTLDAPQAALADPSAPSLAAPEASLAAPEAPAPEAPVAEAAPGAPPTEAAPEAPPADEAAPEAPVTEAAPEAPPADEAAPGRGVSARAAVDQRAPESTSAPRSLASGSRQLDAVGSRPASLPLSAKAERPAVPSERAPSLAVPSSAPPVDEKPRLVGDVAVEVELLDAARAAIAAGDGPRARRLLERYERRFAQGMLAREAAVLRRAAAAAEVR